ncbi:hypothetical protein VCHA30O60_280012 [Vibrio chagasii]|nr:hypothetical protein VCHA30O60_280012 [Vibrio chagasii]CAH7182208.1 hypothetical protein VCHA40O237_340024 [Vibrio chagasii]CAH7235416.1 hypothetical protein VCHA48P437_320012 [Vibrio chagasii]CAH7261162.1 hypothetical protein VCHA44O286_350012 [Vibrio chagasii]CAH7429822.1 hypothetical protein VCHA55O508_340024 [Vibrio chagasii]
MAKYTNGGLRNVKTWYICHSLKRKSPTEKYCNVINNLRNGARLRANGRCT